MLDIKIPKQFFWFTLPSLTCKHRAIAGQNVTQTHSMQFLLEVYCLEFHQLKN